MSQEADIHALLETVLTREIPGCLGLARAERLSGGASQETYRLVVQTGDGTRQLALRRAAGGVATEPAPGHPGLAGEARLMIAARAAGVPEPEVHHVLSEGDGLGPGFVMEWLDGETLGARIVRSEALAEVRPPPRRGVRRGAGAHPRHRRRGHRPRRDPRLHDARTVRPADVGPLPGNGHPAAHDRLHGAVAARPPAGRLRDGARAQRLPQRQLHGGRDGHRRRPRLGGRPHRRPHAGPGLDLHELVALRRRRPGGRIRALRGPVPRLRTRIGEAGESGPGAVLGGLRLLLVGRRLPPDGGALPHGTRPERGAPRHRAAHLGVPGRLRQPADPRPRADPGARRPSTRP